MSPRPDKITLRYYNVGFGDCLLLIFHYGSDERFVLIDFGTTAPPGKTVSAPEQLLKVAKDIEARCGQKLSAVVATHRHKDHVEGFRRKKGGKGSGDVIARCRPELVLLPWTEDPKLDPEAVRPKAALAPARRAVRALYGMQSSAAGVLTEVARLRSSLSAAAARRLEFLGEDNLGNRAALESLWEMGRASPRKSCRYLHHGSRCGLGKLLPGVRVKVLGPPTIAQHAAVLKQRPRDDDEYWHLLGLAGRRAASANPAVFRAAARVSGRASPEHRWILRRLDRMRGELLFEVVRTVDDALNNTSLILLFEIGATKLLFPGDAQIENWEYALKKNKKDLEDVRVYKVGHHGSLNATPKSLWNGFARKSTQSSNPDRLVSICSTKSGVHGHANEVPRKKLVDELKRYSEYRDTPELGKKKRLWGELVLVPT